jgi:hypothetical protein
MGSLDEKNPAHYEYQRSDDKSFIYVIVYGFNNRIRLIFLHLV